MTKPLHLSKNLRLSADAVTQTFGILGKRGSGKTTTASVLAEELLKAAFPLVIIDPTDAWWGLRSSKDGKSDGHPITILGGDHGDAPLEETAGKVIADLVAEEAPPLVLSLARLSKSAGRRFACEFFERLYEKNRTALMVIVDECDEFAPQRIRKGGERLFGAIDTVVRRGRLRGLGVTMISQRSAAINKDILSQCEVLIAHRANHPRDIDPILEWMQVHATKEQIEKVHSTIAQLSDGEAWVMSPEWLDMFGRVQFRDRETFNSSATPKAGERRIVPKRLATVDLAVLQKRMAETIERAKATDPTLLRRRVAELEAQLKKKDETLAKVDEQTKRIETKLQRVEIPVVKPTEIARLEKQIDRLLQAQDRLAQAQQVVVTEAGNLRQAIAGTHSRPTAPVWPSEDLKRSTHAVTTRRLCEPGNGNRQQLPVGECRILTAIAQHSGGCSREQLTVLTGYKRSSRDTYLQRLRERGLVDTAGERVVATNEGVSALGQDFRVLPTGAELLEYWRTRLPIGERTVLESLIPAWPSAVDRERISEMTGYQRSSRDTYLQRLRSRRLIEEAGRGQVKATDMLFDGEGTHHV